MVQTSFAVLPEPNKQLEFDTELDIRNIQGDIVYVLMNL
jgi:hypothetical protein